MGSTIEEYLKNPCRYSALPLYKEKRQNSINIQVIHDSEFKQELIQNKKHKRFFRISHNLKNIDKIMIPGYQIRKYNDETDRDKVVQIINQSYSNIKIDINDVVKMLNDEVFNPDMWIFVVEENTKKEIALGICQYDDKVFEVVFDWIQVIPECRGIGIGLMLVTYLLAIAPSDAKFATVSGDMDNPSSPEKLYRKCGFKGNDVWHILR